MDSHEDEDEIEFESESVTVRDTVVEQWDRFREEGRGGLGQWRLWEAGIRELGFSVEAYPSALLCISGPTPGSHCLRWSSHPLLDGQRPGFRHRSQ